VIDRLTILDLKLQHGGGDHFRNEHAALETRLVSAPITRAILLALLDLAMVNGLLWRAEDDLREWRDQAALGGTDDAARREIVEIAFQIQALNDRRAALVETINKRTGEHRGEEKL
jgi:hypothetical protein